MKFTDLWQILFVCKRGNKYNPRTPFIHLG